jgi:AmmeMemoRadiSam system protein A
VRLDGPGDPELARAILRRAGAAGLPAVARHILTGDPELDHGVIVPMSFLDPTSRYPLIVLSFCGLPLERHLEFGRAVARAAGDLGRTVAFVASGDCSHRLVPGAPAGFSPRGREYDRWLVESVRTDDLDALTTATTADMEEAGECGTRSFVTLSGFLEDTDAHMRLLAYEGPWGVGYMTAVATDPVTLAALPAEPFISEATAQRGRRGGSASGLDASPHTRLARAAIDAYLTDGKRVTDFTGYEELATRRAGAFVSLHRGGELRGCIGCIEPMAPTLAEEIVDKAIAAATEDPRFPRMTTRELDDLDISVDVLQPAEPVSSLSDLDPKRYGVIVTAGFRRGLLLPDLEGVDTAEQQVSISMQKAGISPGTPIALERFQVDRFL